MPKEFHKVEKFCEKCGKKLILNNTRDIKRKRFCSKVCMGFWLVGIRNRKHSDETKEKIRQAHFRLRDSGYIPVGWRKYLPKKRISKSKGYVFLGHKREHQVLMEKELGRKLLLGEVVHHKDQNKLNNNLDNLMVMTRADHTKLHTKLRLLCLNA